MSPSRSAQPLATTARACPVCGGGDLRALPELPFQSMLSDGRVTLHALRRAACTNCGLAMHLQRPTVEAVQETFTGGYDLYAHPPGNEYERERQRRYADWICSIADGLRKHTIFEVGCGNGSLLLELRASWPEAAFAGMEPASAAAHYARQAGFPVEHGFLESTGPGSAAADLVIAVNVIEHTPDPVRFLQAFGDRMAKSGKGIIICPDGAAPSAELLIYDHLYSMTEAALRRSCHTAGLRVIGRWMAPPGLGGFQAVLVEHGEGGGPPVAGDPDLAMRLFESRSEFLLRWRELDARLQQRVVGFAEIDCFGVGEAAKLLRAYAPRLWRRIGAFAVDGGTGFLDGRPVLDYSGLERLPGRAFLLAVRPELQEIMGRRLTNDGHKVVTWPDLTPA